MASDLLDELRGLVTPQLVSTAASRWGESESAVSKGLGAVFPLILAALLPKLSDSSFLSQIMRLLTNTGDTSDVLSNPRSALPGEPSSAGLSDIGGSLLSTVFGGQLGAVTSAVGQQAGVKSTSAASLMTLGASLVTALLGDRVRHDGLSASGLAGLLNSQRDSLLAAVPAALSGVAGLGSLRGPGTEAPSVPRIPARHSSSGWLWGALAAVVLLAGAWALWRTREAPEIRVPVADAGRRVDEGAQAVGDAAQQAGQAVSGAAQQGARMAGDAAQQAGQAVSGAAQQAAGVAGDAAQQVGQAASGAAQQAGRIVTGDAPEPAGQAAGDAMRQEQVALAKLGPLVPRRLPSNVELSLPERGVETQVIAYLDDPGTQLEPAVWFDFDRLLFETGSATLKPESQEQLKNLAEILKAYPSVKVKIGGYTDNTGDAAANLALSQARAANVMNAIVALGIARERLSAEGYGDQYPVADNSTEAGRAQNRRIAFRVTEK